MDPLSHLLDGPRASRAFALRVTMDAPWSIHVRDRAPLTLMAVLAGHAWLVADGESLELVPGDVAIVRGPEPYLVADDPLRAPMVIVHPGQRCTTPAGDEVTLSMTQGVRTWGNAAAGETTLLIGTYETDAEVSSLVTAALPRVGTVPAGHIEPALLDILNTEITTAAPAQSAAIDRLLDVLLVHAVRAWTQLHPEQASGWLAGSTDPLVASALDLLHEAPAATWTVETLARDLNVSRATLAGRFRRVIGEPPMAYLTKWRMMLASESLADPRVTTAQIATDVGYGSPFALSTAFKRQFGVSPTEYRRRRFQA